jgi:hypothetical protein
MSTNTCSSPEIAKVLTERFGTSRKPIKVEMKFTREIGEFIKKVESAQKAADRSNLIF